jgi:hypothetical protein
MSSFDTTDAESIREAMAAAICKILPRYLPQQDSHWVYAPDQEITGTMRTFDILIGSEVDVPLGWYGGGVELTAEVEIRVSYPVSEPDVRRFAGSDGQDLAGTLVRLHLTTVGMLPIATRQPRPIFEILANGEPGRYVGSFFTSINWFASDTVAQVAA